MKAQELASPAQQANLQQLLTLTDPPEQKVSQMLELFRDLNIKSQTQALIQEYFSKAQALGEALASQTNFAPIDNYLQEIINRQV